MFTFFVFLAVLGLIVLVHEFGHFFVARKNGIAVDEFGFGFPPRLLGIQWLKKGEHKRWRVVWGNRELTDEDKRHGVLYSLNWIPLGGFVKIVGENGEEAGPASFGHKSFWQKLAVLLAGVVMNFLLAAVLLSVGFMVGLPQMIDDVSRDAIVTNQQLQVVETVPGKPAEAVGVEAGDVIVQVGTMVSPRLAEMQAYVDVHQDEEISLTVKRGGEVYIKNIHPIVYSETGKGGLGVVIAETGTVRYPWYLAIYYGCIATGMYFYHIVVAFYYFFIGLFTGAGSSGAVSGPVGIAVMTGQVARMGFGYLLQFVALLSLNLAFLNVLPIPALDGGRVFFLVLGKVWKKAASAKIEQTAHTIGFLALMVLVVVITVKDLGAFSGAVRQFIVHLFS